MAEVGDFLAALRAVERHGLDAFERVCGEVDHRFMLAIGVYDREMARLDDEERRKAS
ncbi:MAG: hypothetical protein IT435_16095 [Phycisphaerales bacterium]|nr:hypothetical protein [Phycisphaerales bacterium]